MTLQVPLSSLFRKALAYKMSIVGSSNDPLKPQCFLKCLLTENIGFVTLKSSRSSNKTLANTNDGFLFKMFFCTSGLYGTVILQGKET